MLPFRAPNSINIAANMTGTRISGSSVGKETSIFDPGVLSELDLLKWMDSDDDGTCSLDGSDDGDDNMTLQQQKKSKAVATTSTEVATTSTEVDNKMMQEPICILDDEEMLKVGEKRKEKEESNNMAKGKGRKREWSEEERRELMDHRSKRSTKVQGKGLETHPPTTTLVSSTMTAPATTSPMPTMIAAASHSSTPTGESTHTREKTLIEQPIDMQGSMNDNSTFFSAEDSFAISGKGEILANTTSATVEVPRLSRNALQTVIEILQLAREEQCTHVNFGMITEKFKAMEQRNHREYLHKLGNVLSQLKTRLLEGAGDSNSNAIASGAAVVAAMVGITAAREESTRLLTELTITIETFKRFVSVRISAEAFQDKLRAISRELTERRDHCTPQSTDEGVLDTTGSMPTLFSGSIGLSYHQQKLVSATRSASLESLVRMLPIHRSPVEMMEKSIMMDLKVYFAKKFRDLDTAAKMINETMAEAGLLPIAPQFLECEIDS